MKTMKTEYESALDRNNAAFDRLRADIANRDKLPIVTSGILAFSLRFSFPS